MKKRIQQIDSSIYNRISAGEVVERPMSVIKECVENSLDSGAKCITIYVYNNVKSFRIIDDGMGMNREDSKIAFLPHATSKISCVEDLDRIVTMGFRGEALASIAAVSMITLNTCDSDTSERTRIEIKGGVIENVTESSIDKGTDIVIENLFYNTPVREKFLKSTRSEEGEITNLISRFILAYPSINFTYYLNGDLKIKHNNGTLESAIYSIYGKDAINNTKYIDDCKNGISIKGFISDTKYTKPNKTYQTIILNGRYIINSTIQVAIQKAYQPFLMKRCFPFYVLHITIPVEEVDVNVHPTKNDVRFSDNSKVFSAVYGVISKQLKVNIPADNPTYGRDVSYSQIELFKSSIVDNKTNNDYSPTIKNIEHQIENSYYGVFNNDSISYENNYNKQIIVENTNISYSNSYLKDNKIDKEGIVDFTDLKVIGVFDNTYILAQCNKVLYIIDQHAAHERILYDKYVDLFSEQSIYMQDLLVPYILNLNPIEDSYIRKYISNLFVLGFRIEPFGQNTYRITSIPAHLNNIDFDNFFNEIFKDLDRFNDINELELFNEYIMQKACKNAVKAGMQLKEQEVFDLFKYMNKVSKLTCPHGRPIIVEFTKNEIEKMFKRIVWWN